MRVTNNGIMSSYLRDIQTNLQNMDKLNEQLNTEKQVNRISDDPLKTVKILNIQNEIENTEKYNYNCDEITGWLDITDESLDRIANLSSDIKTKLTSISGAFGKDEIAATRSEVNEKIKQIGEILNTTYAGKYIFGGQLTDIPPVNTNVDKNGIVSLSIQNKDNNNLNKKLNSAISSGLNINYNLTVKDVTGGDKGLKLFNDLSVALSGDVVDTDEIGKLSTKIDNYMNDILNNRSIVGSRTNTIDKVKETNEQNILSMKGALSSIQDVDMTKQFMHLKEAQMVYASSLQVGAKLIQGTLLDYLR
ncbi:flagellin [Clostridium sardiniense]|uniref:flagellin N-terminal helical domain-containing protein n=1 Tax=Clostridium sardiniense TaxID=29369 RepID=UPI0019590B97|nr:flagellin [Clostridium sardiniense]MBM7835430.1 flagellar hook-associated protein 3 FlgL [Clostridium sardiniense]